VKWRLALLAVACVVGCGAERSSRLKHTQPVVPAVEPSRVEAAKFATLDLESHWFEHPSQPGRVMVFEGGPKDSPYPPLVLVHGLGQGSRDFRPVFAALARERRVVSFDLPGFGISARGGAYTPERYAALLDHIVEDTGKDQVDLLGHSLGGAVALLYAGGHPSRVRRLVLVDVAGILHREAFVGDQLEHMGASGGVMEEAAAESLRGFASAMRAFEPDPEPLIRFRMLDGTPEKAAALALIQFNFGWTFAAVTAPTLILWGEHDTTAARRSADILRDRIAGSRLVILPGVGHVPMVDAPDRMAQLVTEHLNAPEIAVPAPVLARSHRVGRCIDARNVTFEGSYAHIEIRNCRRVRLTEVSTGTLVVRNSDAVLTHVDVQDGTRVDDSALLITGGQLAGPIALDVSGSRVDVAGVALTGKTAAVRVRGVSYLLFSVTPASSAIGTRVLHREMHLSAGAKL
jgi:pimeloyl-ACP methyl ester carboxylesterase